MDMRIWHVFVAMMNSHAFNTREAYGNGLHAGYAKYAYGGDVWCELWLRVLGKTAPRLEVWCGLTVDGVFYDMLFTTTNKAHDIRFKVREAFELLAREAWQRAAVESGALAE